MKPWFSKNGVDGFTTDTVALHLGNIGFTTDTDRFHQRYRQFHQRNRVLNLERLDTLRHALTRNADGSASGPLARALDLLDEQTNACKQMARPG